MNADVRNYVIVTASYWGFTLVDGALRMLVLFHFFKLGYSPFTLAFLFLLYEVAGILSNLAGGWLAARFGIPRMLAIGQLLQIGGLLMLSMLDPAWTIVTSVAWVVAAQGIAGVAKDLTKTASKSAIKEISSESNAQLFRLVAWFTGSKNAMKGVGFFLGGLLLQAVGFASALWLMAGLICLVLGAGLLMLPRQLGKAASSKSVKELFGKSRGVNLLAAARVFLFGARDVWFVVALPVYLYTFGWTFIQVGTFLAAWTIGYGFVQAVAPQFVSRSEDGLSAEVPSARGWSLALIAIPLMLAIVLQAPNFPRPDLTVAAGLTVFGFLFAVNSSLHSYLILAYAGSKKAAEDVGFYYAANAAGRLGGILLSGALYQAAGIAGCLVGSAAMLAMCWLITLFLPKRIASDQFAATFPVE
jgi:MFS family permease